MSARRFKLCTNCSNELPPYHRRWCLQCGKDRRKIRHRKESRDFYHKYRERNLAKSNAYYKLNREAVLVKKKLYYQTKKHAIRNN